MKSRENRRVGSKLFFVGGFDQNEGFNSGPGRARQLVFECHAACPDGGYICSPSDAFFLAILPMFRRLLMQSKNVIIEYDKGNMYVENRNR